MTYQMAQFEWIGALGERLERKPMAILLALSLGFGVWMAMNWRQEVKDHQKTQELRVQDQKDINTAQRETIDAQDKTLDMQNKILLQWFRPNRIKMDSAGIYSEP